MARYIDADKLVDIILEEYGIDPYYYQDLNDNLKAYTDSLILERVGTIPTADVVPVVHAFWRKMESQTHHEPKAWSCSNCRSCQIRETKYCSNCGAKMDEEAVE